MKEGIFMNTNPRQNLARSSLIVSIAAIISVLIFPVFLPYVLAPVAIVLAILSRGGQQRAPGPAGIATVLSVIALILNTIIIAFTVLTVVHALQDPSELSQINDYLYQHYGVTLQELLNLSE